jgi:CheY-like chemotaxis protein
MILILGLGKQKIKILIADDNKDVNLLLSATLELKGYEAYKTYSADECLSKLDELEGKLMFYF